MNSFGLALTSVLITVVGHAALLRVLPTRFALLSLAGLVVTVPLALGAASLIGGGLLGPVDWLIGALLAVSLGVAYALLFPGITHDSPTLALANAIADRGESGLSVEEIDRFIASHPFVGSRLEALVHDGLLTLEGENWVLRGRIGLVLYIGEAYRGLCTRQAEAG